MFLHASIFSYHVYARVRILSCTLENSDYIYNLYNLIPVGDID